MHTAHIKSTPERSMVKPRPTSYILSTHVGQAVRGVDIQMGTAFPSALLRYKSAAYQQYLTAASGKSNADARAIAEDILGKSVFWDWDRELSISVHLSFCLTLT